MRNWLDKLTAKSRDGSKETGGIGQGKEARWQARRQMLENERGVNR